MSEQEATSGAEAASSSEAGEEAELGQRAKERMEHYLRGDKERMEHYLQLQIARREGEAVVTQIEVSSSLRRPPCSPPLLPSSALRTCLCPHAWGTTAPTCVCYD